jgi:hypothetical protein
MRSDKQNQASKNNGKKSKGPASPAGKAASSRNAVQHNLSCGNLVLLPNEDPREFHDFQNGYLHRFQPVDAVELDLVQKMIAAAWRERRIVAMESALFEIEMDRQSDTVDEEWTQITPSSRQVLVLFGTTDATTAANLLLRYGAAVRRDLASAMRLLRDLQGPRFNRFRGPLPSGGEPLAQSAPAHKTATRTPRQPDAIQHDKIESEEVPQSAQTQSMIRISVNRRRESGAQNKEQATPTAFNEPEIQNEPEQNCSAHKSPALLWAKAAA